MPIPVEYTVDANVILRFVLGDDPHFSAKAGAIFEAMEAGDATLVCDPVTLAEVVWVLSSYYRASCGDIAEALLPLLKSSGFLIPEQDRYVRALELYGQGLLRFGDACAYATAMGVCSGRLLSFDRKLSRVAGIERTESIT